MDYLHVAKTVSVKPIRSIKLNVFSSITSLVKAKKFETRSGNVKSSLKTHKAMCFTVVNPTCYSETPMTQKAKAFDEDGLALSGGLFRPGLKFKGQ